jgi:hypothetical protein
MPNEFIRILIIHINILVLFFFLILETEYFTWVFLRAFSL